MIASHLRQPKVCFSQTPLNVRADCVDALGPGHPIASIVSAMSGAEDVHRDSRRPVASTTPLLRPRLTIAHDLTFVQFP